ncbi:hypothetical protein TcWFU_010457 [Taenia crassiceps]|uniref:Uncharacterized protein n=1 Tax=Taenia crassiceps TaxID=6207 RepID=A0ABR4QTV2_9CEST
MNAESEVISRLSCSDTNTFDPEIDKASESFVNEQGVSSLRVELKKTGYMGHPIVIEFLLVPKSEVEGGCRFLNNKQIPAYLMERWMIQFLPKRLVTEALSDMSKLVDDINSFCKSSVVNKVLFEDKTSFGIPGLSELCSICRLTNLRRANSFSPCWFTISINELFGGGANTDSANLAFKVIRDFSDNFSTSDGVHTTTRTKSPKRTYLCSSPCSHTHRKDSSGTCVSKALSRVLAGSKEVLDTIVTSVLELPSVPLNDIVFDLLRCLHSGTMSLPTKRWNEMPLYVDHSSTLPDDVSKCRVPKSPIVIMSQWTKPTSFLESPPCKLKRMQQDSGPRVEECISQFTSLSVQQQKQEQTNKSSKAEVCAPNADSVQRHLSVVWNSKKGLTESSSHSLSFNPQTGLPLQSSPIPIKQKSANNFSFDGPTLSLHSTKAPGGGTNGNADSTKTSRPTTLLLKRRSSRRCRTVMASNIAPTTSSCGGGLWGGGGVCMPGTPLPPCASHQLLINFEVSWTISYLEQYYEEVLAYNFNLEGNLHVVVIIMDKYIVIIYPKQRKHRNTTKPISSMN